MTSWLNTKQVERLRSRTAGFNFMAKKTTKGDKNASPVKTQDELTQEFFAREKAGYEARTGEVVTYVPPVLNPETITAQAAPVDTTEGTEEQGNTADESEEIGEIDPAAEAAEDDGEDETAGENQSETEGAQ